jgi:hypothetical protein
MEAFPAPFFDKRDAQTADVSDPRLRIFCHFSPGNEQNWILAWDLIFYLSGGITMKKVKIGLLCLVSALLAAPPVFAQDPIIYPNKGQSAEQQEKDKFECYTWAKGQTGFDPMQVPTATTPPPAQQAPKSSAVRGAAGGALAGVAIGAIAGDAGKGAAIGAASGALIGGMRRHDQQQQQQAQQQQWEQEQAANYANQRNNYNRAYGACLEGHGYTVK